MPREVAIRLVVSGAQEAKRVLDNFANSAGTRGAQAAALNRGAIGIERELFGSPVQSGQLRQELLATANTVRLLTDRTIDFGGEIGNLTTTSKVLTGNLNNILAAQKNYGAALDSGKSKLIAAQKEVDDLKSSYQGLISVQNRAAAAAQNNILSATGRVSAADARVAKASGLLDQARGETLVRSTILGQGRADYAAGRITSNTLAVQQYQLEQAIKQEARASQHYTAVTNAAANEKANASKALTKAQQAEAAAVQESARLRSSLATQQASILGAANQTVRQSLVDARGRVIAAYRETPPTPAALSSLAAPTSQGGSPALLRKLQQAGLGGGAAFGSDAYRQNLINQGAYESINIQKDLVRQVTRVTGSFQNQQGVLQSFNAEYDKGGRVITRFGSNLSGLGNVLNQLGRDFQKVIEFAIATTVVFGSFRYAIEQIGRIRDLDKSIRQLSITAGLSRPEAIGLFEDIADVAISTATPLTEMIKATDDIALATKRAGQSSAEWREEILSLSQSVGILTNLAGIDTVEATDQLVATMKQLGVEADDLPGILNKVTAVAGGQSNAIADVIKGLSVLAEAGQQANLSIDQMIATLQVLSQVTSKSPAEVATALKQLIGALDGPAGTKALDKYNIALRNTDGSLRNIIDIYTEISNKIQSGVIPQGDVKGLVRAIAGGPRRAPDAAALLASVGEISGVEERSLNATNEALLANAKILDTAAAKFVQLQAAIDKFATTKFADILNQGATALVNLLTTVLDILQAIPTPLYLLVIQFGLLAGAVKFAVSVGGYMVSTFANMALGAKNLAVSLLSATAAQNSLNASQRISPILGPNGKPIVTPGAVPSRFSGLQAGRLGGAAAIGALAGAATASTGAAPQQFIGAGIQTAGLALLLTPEPTLVTKALGLAALAAGTALQFFGGEAEKTGQAVKASSEEILNAVDSYKNISQQVESLTEEQETLGRSIDDLQATKHRTADEDARLIALQQEYGENASQLIITNLALTDSFQRLNSVLESSPFNQYRIDAARAGAYSQGQLRNLTQDIAPQILSATNPAFVAPDDLRPRALLANLGQPLELTQDEGYKVAIGALNKVFASEGGTFVLRTSEDLKNLSGNVQEVTQLMSELSLATVSPTDENLQLIDEALISIKNDVPEEEFRRLQLVFQNFAAQNNILFATARGVATYKAYLEAGGATGLFTPEDVKNGNAILDIYKTLADLIPQAENRNFGEDFRRGERGGEEVSTREQILAAARKFAFDEQGNLRTNITKTRAIEVGTEILKAAGTFDELEEKGAVLSTIAGLFSSVGAEVRGLTDNISILGAAADENLAKFLEGLQEVSQEVTSGAASNLANLQSQFQAGEFEGNEDVYRRNIAQQQALISTVNQVTETFSSSAEAIAENGGSLDGALRALAPSLANINGLQDAASLSGDQLIARMFSLAEVYGLTGDQVVNLATKMINLLDTIKQVAAIKAQFRIGVDVDLSDAISKLQSLKASYQRHGRFGGGPTPYDEPLAALIAAQNSFSSFATDVATTYAGGDTTRFKVPSTSAAKKPQGPDISDIDIPEEIAKSTNMAAILQEAIRRAKALQAKYPAEYRQEARNDIVELLKGTQRVLEVRGVKDDLLRQALEELAEIEKKRLEFETKADTISRIRVGAGSFAGLVNVPFNRQTGVSVGGPEGPITVNLNINGQVLTPAQFSQLADQIGAVIKNQIAG